MKRFIVAIIVILFFIGIAFSVKLDRSEKRENRGGGIPMLTKFYESTKIKKTKKEIERKIYSKTFYESIKNLELKKLEAINYLVGRESLANSLNSKNRVMELKKIDRPDITSKEAEEIFLVSRELTELGNITPELRIYLKGLYGGFDYENFAKKGDSILSYIRNKELIIALLPKNMGDIIAQLPPIKAEIVMGILDGKGIPSKIEYTTNDFIKLKLTYEEMEGLHRLSTKLYRLGEVEENFFTEANRLYLDLDYTRIAKYGNFYLQEKESLERIAKNYIPERHSFRNPFILINPYGRVENIAFLIYPGVEKERVEVTVKGRDGGEDFTYIQTGREYITVYGLHMNGEANKVVIKEGSKVTELEIEAPQISDELPIIKVGEKTLQSSKFYYTGYRYENNIYGIGFDVNGRIRYILNPTVSDSEGWNLKKNGDEFIFFNQDIVFVFNFKGKIKESYSRWKYENEIGSLKEEKLGDLSVKTVLHEENKKTLTTVPFMNNGYPKGQITENLLNRGERVFLADIYLDKNSGRKNRIFDGEIMGFPPLD